MQYEITLEYRDTTHIIISTEGKFSVAGFILDALENHENGKHRLRKISLDDVTPIKRPVAFDRREESVEEPSQ